MPYQLQAATHCLTCSTDGMFGSTWIDRHGVGSAVQGTCLAAKVGNRTFEADLRRDWAFAHYFLPYPVYLQKRVESCNAILLNL